MCQATCPIYAVTRNEGHVARGKLALLDGLMLDMFENPDGVSEQLNRCLLCGSCATICPRDVNVLEIFLKARAIIAAYKGLSPLKKVMFQRLLSNPNLFNRVMAWGSKWQYLFAKKTGMQADASCGQLISPLLSKRHMVPLAPVPFHKMNIEQVKNKPASGVKVAFFVGCLLDKVFPHVAQSIVTVLNHHGVDVIIPDSQGCCGIPALASGDRDSFNHLVDYSLKQFDPSGFDYLVTGCATCTATIKKIWPAMMDPDVNHKLDIIRQLSEKTVDIGQFLVEKMGVKSSKEQISDESKPVITYHDPCHLRKTLDIYSEPRELICANQSYIFKEMAEADTCCGMGGSFNLMHYDLSTDIGAKKAVNIDASGASVVATGCPACMIQLSDMLAREKESVTVAHFIEIYAESL
jgi:glycolate oxidase iron-sulfur subunit